MEHFPRKKEGAKKFFSHDWSKYTNKMYEAYLYEYSHRGRKPEFILFEVCSVSFL
jgi:hypothetical protein